MIEKKIKTIVSFLQNYLKDNNLKGYIFGLSGGIDSSVIAAIMSKYFPKNHLALIMNINNNIIDIKDQKKVIDNYQLNYENIQLEDIFNLFKKSLCVSDLSYNNLKSRLRAVTLYAKAQDLNYLVLGTSNFNEIYTGYFTKYGDSACDVMPLANLLKKDIYEIAKYLNVPKSIINKSPSAGLFEGQTDENDLQLTYKEMDNFFLGFNIEKSIKERITTLYKNNVHKIKGPVTILPMGKILKIDKE